MVSTGTAKLIILVVILTTFYAFFDYSIRGTFETISQPSGITEMQYARMNMTTPYSVFHNVTRDDPRQEFDIVPGELYGATWTGPTSNWFSFDFKHVFWTALDIEIPGVYGTIDVLPIVDVVIYWDDTRNYTRIIIDPRGGKEQNVYFFIRANSTHYLYENITASINAGEVGMLLGGQLPRLETDFFAIVGVVGTSFLTGLAAPFTATDYPVVLSLINYMIVILAAIALALLLRG